MHSASSTCAGAERIGDLFSLAMILAQDFMIDCRKMRAAGGRSDGCCGDCGFYGYCSSKTNVVAAMTAAAVVGAMGER